MVLCGGSDESSQSGSENLTDDIHQEERSDDQVNESSNSSSDEDEPAFMVSRAKRSGIEQKIFSYKPFDTSLFHFFSEMWFN